MPFVVGVRFKRAGKIYYFEPSEDQLLVGSKVVVETARGVEYGDVCIEPREVPEEDVVQPLKKVIRVGNERDAAIVEENRRKQKEAYGLARRKIEQHNLDMHLVEVEYTFDGSKVIFYFTAEGRVDFRELVKDLAAIFRTRIEMRQIGVRDEAKLIGGIGPCGRILCCTSFLGEFAPVSIRMAKDQNLSLNPSKISGACGRLMCCLRYEQETYEAAKKDPTLAPGYAPPPVEKVAEYVSEYKEDEPAANRAGSFANAKRLDAAMRNDALAARGEARVSGGPTPRQQVAARPAGNQGTRPVGQSAQPQRGGQGTGQQGAGKREQQPHVQQAQGAQRPAPQVTAEQAAAAAPGQAVSASRRRRRRRHRGGGGQGGGSPAGPAAE